MKVSFPYCLRIFCLESSINLFMILLCSKWLSSLWRTHKLMCVGVCECANSHTHMHTRTCINKWILFYLVSWQKHFNKFCGSTKRHFWHSTQSAFGMSTSPSRASSLGLKSARHGADSDTDNDCWLWLWRQDDAPQLVWVRNKTGAKKVVKLPNDL